jgi:hypothetical protein
MKINIMRKAAGLADSALDDWGPVGLPQGRRYRCRARFSR